MQDPITHQQITSNQGLAINNTGEFIVHGDITQINNLYQLPQPPTPAEMAQIVQKAHDHLATMPTEAFSDVGNLPAQSRILYGYNPNFVGREPELRQLAAATQAGHNVVIAATGIGGMGKSQLAIAFAHRYGRYFAGGVYWVSLAEAASVNSEVAQCGGLHLHPQFFNLPLPDQVRLVRQSWQEELPRLLIFDNCEEEQLLHDWLPKTGGARVLVTSRKGEWGRELGVQTVPLNTLTRAQSVTLLRQLAPQFVDEQWDNDLHELAAEIGDFPLALHLAGSYLEKYGQHLPPAKLTAELRSDGLRSKVLTHHAWDGVSPTGHEWAVARTFELSFEQLSEEQGAGSKGQQVNEVALTLLARAACFAPGEPIPEELLFLTMQTEPTTEKAGCLGMLMRLLKPNRVTVDWSETEFIDGVERLVELGLLERAEGQVQLHRLLGLYVQEAVGTEMAQEAQAAVEDAIARKASKLNEAGYPQVLQAWVNHLQHITDNALLRHDRDVLAATLCANFGYHLKQTGDNHGALPYYEQALAIDLQVYGKRHSEVATDLNNLGMLLDNMRYYVKAQSYIEEALAIRQELLGKSHPDTAQSLNDLGLLLAGIGEYVEAQPYYEQALAIYRDVLGDNHPHTATSLDNLGELLRNIGEYAKARPYIEQALAIYQDVLGESHPYTATSLNNLAWLCYHEKDFDTAVDLMAEALAIAEETLGADHPRTQSSRRDLATFRSALSSRGQA